MKKVLILTANEEEKQKFETTLKVRFPELFVHWVKNKEEASKINPENYDFVLIDATERDPTEYDNTKGDYSFRLALLDEICNALVDCAFICNPNDKNLFLEVTAITRMVSSSLQKNFDNHSREKWSLAFAEAISVLSEKKDRSPKLNLFDPEAKKFRIWKTIELGNYQNPNELGEALFKINRKLMMSNWAYQMIARRGFINEKRTIDLVLVSLEELGFTDKAELEEIIEKTREFGLEICPDEVGPQLLLQPDKCPPDEWLKIAMNYNTGPSGGYPLIYRVKHNNQCSWLQTSYVGHDSYHWYPDDKVVFSLPR